MKRQIFISLTVVAIAMLSRNASAFWGSDSQDGTSGLDVAAGFDVNTVTTVNGTVITPPERKGTGQHTEMGIAAPQGAVTVVLGPWSYWEKQTIVISKSQDIVITGSLAQGKDGAFYVFAQRLENRDTGETVTLRAESGKPMWAGSGAGSQNGTRQNFGSGPRSGAGSRGSGMRGGRR